MPIEKANTQKMTVDSQLELRVLLTGDYYIKFLRIKKRIGIEANTDVIRYIITEKYEKLFGMSDVL